MAEKRKIKFKNSLRVKLLIGLSTIIAIALMFPRGQSIELEVSVGSIWIHDDLISPFSFPVLKDTRCIQLSINFRRRKCLPRIYIKKQQPRGSIRFAEFLQ